MSITLSADGVERLLAYSHNLRWVKSHGEDLAPFEGKFVAVVSGKVLAAAQTSEELERKFGRRKGIYIGYVAKVGTKWVL